MYAVQVTNRLTEAVRAVCPVDGLSVGTVGDSGTVRLDFRADATAEEREAGAAVVAGFDWSPEAHQIWAVGRMRGDAGTSALADASGTSVANRAAEAQGTTRDNDLAEVLAVLIENAGLTAGQVADLIAARRVAVPPPVGAPEPVAVVASATARLEAPAIAQTVGYLIAVGAGDPLA